MNQPQPAPAQAAPNAPATPKPEAKGPEVPPSPVPAAKPGEQAPAPEVKKPANQIEAEMASHFGQEEWDKMSPAVRERVISAEMKSREADKRMQLVAKLKKDLDMTTAQTGQLIEALKKDPWKVLSNPALGHDVRKLAEEYVWQMIQEQRMTPEQRQAAQDRLENMQMKAEREQQKKDQEQREMDALIAQRRAYWEKTIPESIEANGLPKTSYTVRRFTEYIRAAAKARIPADMPAIAQHIKQELVDLQGRFLLPARMQGETDEQYEDRVLASAPNDYIKMLRKADLRRLRAKGLKPNPGPKPGSNTPTPQKKMLMSEWLAQKEQRMGRT